MAKSKTQSRAPKKPPKRASAAGPAASVSQLVSGLRGDEDAREQSAAATPATDEPDVTEVADPAVDGSDDVSGQAVDEAEAGGAVRPSGVAGVDLVDEMPIDPDDDLSLVEDGEVAPRLVSIIESILFAAERPLGVSELRRLLKDPSKRQIQLALKHVLRDTADRGVVLAQVARGFRFRTNPENAMWVHQLLAAKPARLSRSQLEALAIIAYRQPITKSEIDHVRGVDCGAVLKVLLERNLVRIVGRKEEPGRPQVYGTTLEFLEFFSLRNLRDLPDLREFSELNDESQATLRTTLGPDGEELELGGQDAREFGDRELKEALGQEVLSLPHQDPEQDSDQDPDPASADAANAAGDDIDAERDETTLASSDPVHAGETRTQDDDEEETPA